MSPEVAGYGRRVEDFAPESIQLPFHARAEAEDAAKKLSERGFEVRVLEWVDGWWVTSIEGPIDRLRSDRENLMAAWEEAQKH